MVLGSSPTAACGLQLGLRHDLLSSQGLLGPSPLALEQAAELMSLQFSTVSIVRHVQIVRKHLTDPSSNSIKQPALAK